MPTDDSSEYQALLRNLAHEVFQTETSASKHCRREAERYKDTPVEQVLLAVANHADVALREFKSLAEQEDLPTSVPGGVLGEAFSLMRDFLADRTIEAERSYRGTLLGIRHGIDVMHMVEHVATAGERPALAEWVRGWLRARTPLAQAVEEQLAWFAKHVTVARRRAH
jgi:hypothetical protein